jgi:hypothetical protein
MVSGLASGYSRFFYKEGLGKAAVCIPKKFRALAHAKFASAHLVLHMSCDAFL